MKILISLSFFAHSDKFLIQIFIFNFLVLIVIVIFVVVVVVVGFAK